MRLTLEDVAEIKVVLLGKVLPRSQHRRSRLCKRQVQVSLHVVQMRPGQPERRLTSQGVPSRVPSMSNRSFFTVVFCAIV